MIETMPFYLVISESCDFVMMTFDIRQMVSERGNTVASYGLQLDDNDSNKITLISKMQSLGKKYILYIIRDLWFCNGALVSRHIAASRLNQDSSTSPHDTGYHLRQTIDTKLHQPVLD
jgi:hypothetical protein